MPDSETIQSLSVEAFKLLLNNITNMKDFVIEQAPDICKQILAFGFVSNIVYITLCVLIIAMSLYVIKYITKDLNLEKSHNDENDGICFFTLVLCGIIVISFGIMIKDILELLKIYYAPKLYLIDYIMNIVNSRPR
jgi:hypothetical protein